MNEKQKSVKENLLKAIKYLNINQKEFAKILEIPTSTLNDWLNKTFKVPFQFALVIEALTEGYVDCFHLAPQSERFMTLLKKYHFLQLKNKSDYTISQRVVYGLLLEEVIKFPPLSGKIKMLDWVAKQVGLGNGQNYEKAKFVVKYGSPFLKQTMDELKLSIPLCFQIAAFPFKQQDWMATLDKKSILYELTSPKQEKKIDTMPKALTIILQDSALQALEFQQRKPYRLALMGLIVLQCHNGKFLSTCLALETFYQNTLQISVSECIALLENRGWLKREKHYIKIHFDISTKKVHQYA